MGDRIDIRPLRVRHPTEHGADVAGDRLFTQLLCLHPACAAPARRSEIQQVTDEATDLFLHEGLAVALRIMGEPVGGPLELIDMQFEFHFITHRHLRFRQSCGR